MGSTRRNFLQNISMMGTLPFIHVNTLRDIREQSPTPPAKTYGNVIEPPEDAANWPEFRKEIQQWRELARKDLKYTGASYQDPAFQWANQNYTCGFLMMYDLEFYDPKSAKYTIHKIIERGVREFGGYDSVVLWHAYPRIGIDERNQFDFYRDMPGGLEGVKKVVDEFREKKIRVFINYNPWDVSTRREPKSDIDGLIEIVDAIGADGIFLDTMKKATEDFREKLDKVKPGIALEGELAAELEILPTHHLSWAQWFEDKYVPGILRNKWYERKHMQHQIMRWNRDHTSELHLAWMNGSGMMIWENVFGQWIAWSGRDKSILRTMLPIQRRYHQHFISENWTPLVNTEIDGIFASLWESKGVRLWTLINRHEREISGDLLKVNHSEGYVYFDLVAGKELVPEKNDSSVALKGSIHPRSVGCVISGKRKDLGNDLVGFLAIMSNINKEYNTDQGFPAMAPDLKAVKPTVLNKPMDLGQMVEIKPVTIAQTYEFMTRECGTLTSYPELRVGPLGKPLIFQRAAHIPHLAIDVTPVTNKQYYTFIQATGYHPAEKHNFLKHWRDGKPPSGKENHPVVHVDLDDARAYAFWAGKRLPRETEWQFAAQGYDQLTYPWGKELKDNCFNKGNDTTAVDAFPLGKSPFGCLDMCGNTWEMTESEYADKYNRFFILKGGSYFNATGSMWYTAGGPQPSAVATKFLLLYPGVDRCSTIGFRCVKDLA